jgi:hypothetical protein
MALLIRTDDTLDELRPAKPPAFSLQEIHHAIGGYMEVVPLPHFRLYLVANEDGIRLGLPVNGFATLLVRKFTVVLPTPVVGDCLIATAEELGGYD